MRKVLIAGGVLAFVAILGACGSTGTSAPKAATASSAPRGVPYDVSISSVYVSAPLVVKDAQGQVTGETYGWDSGGGSQTNPSSGALSPGNGLVVLRATPGEKVTVTLTLNSYGSTVSCSTTATTKATQPQSAQNAESSTCLVTASPAA